MPLKICDNMVPFLKVSDFMKFVSQKNYGKCKQKTYVHFGPIFGHFLVSMGQFYDLYMQLNTKSSYESKKIFLHSVNFHYEIELKTVFKIAANTIDKN